MRSRTRVLAGLVFGAILGLGVALFADETSASHPSALFKEYCSKCHGDDGKGQTQRGKMLKAQDFTDAEWQAGESDADLIKAVAEGDDDMPAFGKKLTAGADREPRESRRAGLRPEEVAAKPAGILRPRVEPQADSTDPRRLPFRACGEDVTIYPRAQIVSPEVITIGDSVIIDDFVFIMGGVETRIGSFVAPRLVLDLPGRGPPRHRGLRRNRERRPPVQRHRRFFGRHA